MIKVQLIPRPGCIADIFICHTKASFCMCKMIIWKERATNQASSELTRSYQRDMTGVDLKLTRAKEFLGLSALHGPLLLKLQHRRPEDPLDLLWHVPPGLVVLGLGCAARLHLSRMGGQAEDSVTSEFRLSSSCFNNCGLDCFIWEASFSGFELYDDEFLSIRSSHSSGDVKVDHRI